MASPTVLSSKSGNWQTPQALLDLVVHFNRGFAIGLDPCSAPGNPCSADVHWHPPKTDGLRQSWQGNGLVYVNPPYRDMRMWTSKIVAEVAQGDVEVMLLCPPRTDTRWFRDVWTASAIAFWHGSGVDGCPLRAARLQFVDPATGAGVNGNTSPSALAYWGDNVKRFAATFSAYAQVVQP